MNSSLKPPKESGFGFNLVRPFGLLASRTVRVKFELS